MLTKQQKIDFCNYAIAYYEDDPYEGLCSLFDDWFGGNVDLLTEIPEIKKHEPYHYELFWFSLNAAGFLKRIQILKTVKEELYASTEYAAKD